MADKDFKIWKGETKVFMAIERTMIGWLRYAGTIGVGAFAVNVLGHGSFKGATGALGAAQALAAILIAVGAYVRYRQRIKLVQQRYHGAFGDVAMPAIAGFVTLVLLGGVVCVGFERWYGYTFRAAECAPLPYPVFDGAKPPFLYLSFHGSNQPVNAYCHAALGVSGVHRFALSENGSVKYAGPAVDQHSALLKMPRGMAQARKLLFILDGSAQDSSVAVFGECPTESGLAVRPFLGRIRPEGAKLAAAFSHPYGMSTTSSGALRISAQNGGAVVGIDLATGDMSVVQKVAQPYSSHMRTLDEKSGPLRDIVIDESGCSHVADRVDGLVRHYCPADGDLVASSKVTNPIGLALDPEANLLYVGSYSCTERPSSTCAVHSRIMVFKLHFGSSPKKFEIEKISEAVAPSMVHPAGLLFHNETLFVLEQTTRSLVSFTARRDGNLTYHGALLKDLPDVPEQMLISFDDC